MGLEPSEASLGDSQQKAAPNEKAFGSIIADSPREATRMDRYLRREFRYQGLNWTGGESIPSHVDSVVFLSRHAVEQLYAFPFEFA